MDLPAYYEKYGKDIVDQAIDLLKYKNVATLPKHEQKEPILYIFRHGQTEDNAEFIFSGWRDSNLTAKGKEQALSLADILKEKKIDMLISSPQTRAIETMKLAVSKNIHAKDLEIHTDPRIKERSYGILQGKSKLEIYLEDKEKLEHIRRSYDYAVPDGESIEAVCKRVAAFCDEIVPLMKQTNVNVAISCHGNSIRGFRKYFEHLSDEETATVETPLAQDYLAYEIR